MPGMFAINVTKLIVQQQLYRPLDTSRVAALEKEFLTQSNNFYQPICAMVSNLTKDQFTQENGTDFEKVITSLKLFKILIISHIFHIFRAWNSKFWVVSIMFLRANSCWPKFLTTWSWRASFPFRTLNSWNIDFVRFILTFRMMLNFFYRKNIREFN